MAFKWGIIGPGNIAKEFANDLSLARNEQHQVHSVLAKEQDEATAFACDHNAAKACTDLDEFLHDVELDAIYIATPHSLHHEQAISCLNAGIPVLCEKPVAINSTQLEEMIAAATCNNVFLMEGMWIRFLPSVRRTMEIVQSGILGPIVHLRADMSYRAPKEEDNRFYNPELGGGSLLDLGIYPVFLANLLFGRPDAIKATGRLSTGGVDETCAALLDYNSGQYAVAESSIVTQTSLEAEIFGERGKLLICRQWNEKPPALRLELYSGEKQTIGLDWEGRGFQFEVEEVQACISAGKLQSSLMSHELSRNIMATMDEIRRQMQVRYPLIGESGL